MPLNSKSKQAISFVLLIAFHLSGLIAIGSGHFPNFILLTPLNLLVSLAVVLWNHPQWSRESVFVLALSFVVGLGVEMAGVNSGLIFGEYRYGSVLGWKVWETPLIIGANWALLVYCTGSTMNALMPHSSWLLRSILGALGLTILDYFIEPVAIHYDMWRWAESAVPLQNYLAWFVVSLLLLGVFQYFQGKILNKVAYYLLIIQFLFFWILGQLIV